MAGVSFHPVPVISVIGSWTVVVGSGPIWLRQIQSAFVFGAYRVLEEVSVAQAHLGGDVSEQRHECLQ